MLCKFVRKLIKLRLELEITARAVCNYVRAPAILQVRARKYVRVCEYRSVCVYGPESMTHSVENTLNLLCDISKYDKSHTSLKIEMNI